MTIILLLSECRSRMSYMKGLKSSYILRYHDVEQIHQLMQLYYLIISTIVNMSQKIRIIFGKNKMCAFLFCFFFLLKDKLLIQITGMQDEQEVFIKILKSINSACLQYTRKKNLFKSCIRVVMFDYSSFFKTYL